MALVIALATAACAGSGGAGPANAVPSAATAAPPAATPGPTPDAAPTGAPATPATNPPATQPPGEIPAATAAAEPPAITGWRGMALVNARTGETFTVGDLAGRLVAIEPMAAWCSNCLRQQKEARKALERLDSDDVVYISLGVDPGEKAAELARYADDEGFGWTFAVATKDVLRELAKEFGDQVLSPPSTPFILVGADGTVIEQHFGARGADDLAAVLAANHP
jgi:cytochrome oxidase Cu insertion factor (SCO1/SenC/PrrC family)